MVTFPFIINIIIMYEDGVCVCVAGGLAWMNKASFSPIVDLRSRSRRSRQEMARVASLSGAQSSRLVLWLPLKVCASVWITQMGYLFYGIVQFVSRATRGSTATIFRITITVLLLIIIIVVTLLLLILAIIIVVVNVFFSAKVCVGAGGGGRVSAADAVESQINTINCWRSLPVSRKHQRG